MGMRELRTALVCCVVVLSAARISPAGADSGEFSGIVSSAAGAGLPGARLQFVHRQSGRVIETVSGSRGLYRAGGLPPGSYDVLARSDGFYAASRSDLTLADGEARALDFELPPATRQDFVTVAAPDQGLEAAEARESPARDVGEALSRSAGITSLRKGGIAADLVLRGLQSKDLNVLIDGARVYGACPNRMDPATFHVDFAEVERVEVEKAPFDVRNAGSLGGIINVITRRPAPAFHATGNLSAGSYGYVNPSATASYANTKISLLGGYSWRRSKPYTDGAGMRFTEFANYRPADKEDDAFRIGTAWGNWSVQPAVNKSLRLAYTRQGAEGVLYPYLLMDAVYDDTDRLSIAYEIDPSGGPVRSLRLQAYSNQVRHWMTDALRTSSVGAPRPYGMGTFAKTRADGGRVEVDAGRVAAGVEVFRRFWRGSTQLAGMGYAAQNSIPDVAAVASGAYAEYRNSITDRLRIAAGARVDRIRSAADSALVPSNLYLAYHRSTSTSATDAYPSGYGRLTYSLPSGLSLGVGGASAQRVPDAIERYFGLRRGGSDWVGNPDLEPSRNSAVEMSASYRRSGMHITFDAFRNAIRDYVTVLNAPRLQAMPGITNRAARSFQNVDATFSGAEVEALYTAGRRVFLTGLLSYVRSVQRPDTAKGIRSRFPAEVPPLRSGTRLRYDTGRAFAEIEGIWAAPQRRINADLLEQPTAGFGIANLSAGLKSRRVAVTLVVGNLFGRRYLEFLSYQRDPFRLGSRIYEPGRNVYVNIQYRR